jgi:teichuronic acid exporter
MNKDLSAEPGKLDKQFAGGVAWTAAAKWISQLVSWPSVIIAARILSPSDFGMVEMAGFYFTLTNVLAEFGIGTAILQLRELEEKTIQQMNTISLMFGVFACGLSLAVAPLIADFFHAPPLTLLVRVSSVAFIMIGLQAVPVGLLQRGMDYRKISLTEAIQAVIQAAATIAGALGGLGYWTLPIANLAGRLASLGMTWYWMPISFARPTGKAILEPMKFGMEIALQRMAWMLYLQSDAIVVGRTMGQSVLGMYRLAISLASAPADKVGMLVMRVTGPLFARIQDDLPLVRRYFLIMTEVLALALIPLVCGLVVVAAEAVRVVLGPNWAGAVVPLQWLAVFSVIRTLSSLGGQVLTALRLTRFNSWMVAVNVTVMPFTFLIASHWGAGVVAAGWVLMSPVTNLPSLLKLLKVVDCGKRRYLTALFPALIASAPMVGVLVAAKVWWIGHWSPLSQLAVEIPLGGAIYGGVLLAFFRKRILHYVRFVLELRKSAGTADARSPGPPIEELIPGE